jgi:hypothetical protein
MATAEKSLLEERHRRLHRALIEAVLATGAIPESTGLAEQLGTTPAAIDEGLGVLTEADYLALDANGQIACLYPFSVTPSPHVVIVSSKRRFAMCAIDALGIPAMLGRELAVEGCCAICGAAIALRVRPGANVTAAPATTMVAARRDEAEPAFAACCPFTVFVCGQDHADQFLSRITGAHALSLDEALAHAEAIFGNLLAEAIPASRPRGKHWGRSGDA